MARRKLRPVMKKLTPEDKARHDEIRRQVESDKPRLNRIGLQAKARYEARRARLKDALAALKQTRREMGLSLADLEARTGIAKANLSRLENAADPNPTIDTLSRYAAALGKEIVIVLSEESEVERTAVSSR